MLRGVLSKFKTANIDLKFKSKTIKFLNSLDLGLTQIITR